MKVEGQILSANNFESKLWEKEFPRELETGFLPCQALKSIQLVQVPALPELRPSWAGRGNARRIGESKALRHRVRRYHSPREQF
jgi:hypothetical protein